MDIGKPAVGPKILRTGGMSKLIMMWSLLGCFGTGDTAVSLDEDTEPRVVLADAGLVFGGDGSLSGWKVDAKSVQRFTPTGDGIIVAAASIPNGVAVISKQSNGTTLQLWTESNPTWTEGAALSHGPINQLLVAQDGALWTEGDKGVHRSTDTGATWTRMNVPTNLRLGSRKMGISGGRVAFAGPKFLATMDNGTTWQTLFEGTVHTTDGTWVAGSTNKPSLRVGRVVEQGIEWTDEIDGAWNPSAIHGHSKGVRIVATQQLSTQVEVFQGTEQGKNFARTRIDSRPAWVGLGERVMWMDTKQRIHFLP